MRKRTDRHTGLGLGHIKKCRGATLTLYPRLVFSSSLSLEVEELL
ncbi:hypothetical protein DAI22_11g154100 [Oryza sativa Japonica Group]|nr:hypothetical protein DAI22_11g154100 [Oryza sativa Japonica Group]